MGYKHFNIDERESMYPVVAKMKNKSAKSISMVTNST